MSRVLISSPVISASCARGVHAGAPNERQSHRCVQGMIDARRRDQRALATTFRAVARRHMGISHVRAADLTERTDLPYCTPADLHSS
jgi:hypothetical protein